MKNTVIQLKKTSEKENFLNNIRYNWQIPSDIEFTIDQALEKNKITLNTDNYYIIG